MDMRTPYVTAAGISRVLYNLGFNPRYSPNSGYWCSQTDRQRETVNVSYRTGEDQAEWSNVKRITNKRHMINEYATELEAKGYVVENHGMHLKVSKPKKDGSE